MIQVTLGDDEGLSQRKQWTSELLLAEMEQVAPWTSLRRSDVKIIKSERVVHAFPGSIE